MAQISIIQKIDIIEANRFDADYYKPEYLKIDKKIKGIKTKPLGKLATKITDFGAYSQNSFINYISKSEYFFIRNKDVKDFFLSDEDRIFIEKEVYDKLTLKIEENDLLLQRTGTIGKSAIALKKDIPSSANQNLAQVKLDYTKVNPYYVLTYLNSYYGNKYFEKLATGNVQPWLNLSQIEKLKIPIFSVKFQQNIEKIVKEAHKKQTQSKELYKEAEQLLLKELNLLNYKPKHSLTYETKSNEVENATRFDAEYFQPKYAEIIKRIEKYKNGFDCVKNIISWKKGIEVGSEAYTEQGKEFVRVSDFSVFGVEEASKKISDELYSELKENYQPKKDDILFTKDGTIGITSVLKNDIEGVLSSAFLTLTLKEKYKDFEKECLALILNSNISKMQVEKLSGGAIIAHLKPSDFETFKIPIIEPEIQKHIAKKITESFKLKKESKELLETAKRKVEEEIEKE